MINIGQSTPFKIYTNLGFKPWSKSFTSSEFTQSLKLQAGVFDVGAFAWVRLTVVAGGYIEMSSILDDQ
jgi:hypothetical protein